MRSLFFCFAALAMTAPAYTQTTPPAAPSVTAGAELKGLRFDWESVPGAGWYQFEYRAHQTGPFVQLGANYPAATTNIRLRLPLHLFDWTYARYRIAACNSAGCARSNEVSVSNLRTEAPGYFKASGSLPGFQLGADTDITPDGLTFVAAAPGDYQYGVNGYVFESGAVYVFRRDSTGKWTERARLIPDIPPFNPFGNEVRVGLSADGNTVVMGIPNWRHTQDDTQTGEVYVFHFNGSSWIRTRLQTGNRGRFGRWVAINDAGDTIATPYGEADASTARVHRVAIYKLVNGTWTPVRGITDRAGHVEFCGEGVLSSDGAVLAETCDEQPPGTLSYRTYLRTHSGPNWTVREDVELFLPEDPSEPLEHFGLAIDATGKTLVAQINEFPPNPEYLDIPSEVQVFTRGGSGWSKTATFKPGPWRRTEDRALFGRNVAISADGGTITVGDVTDNGFGLGPRAAPLTPDTRAYGGVYVYRLKSNWVLANMVKPNVRPQTSQRFGRELALNGNGQTLLVGNPADCSDAVGIEGGEDAVCSGFSDASGAVLMY